MKKNMNMMKSKAKVTGIVLTMLLTCFGLTGCDSDDQYLADLLRNRDWQGYIGTYYQDRWGITGEEFRTVMRFTSSDVWATSGRGEELDYSTYSSNSYAYATFKWFIVDGEITLLYDDSVWDPIYILDYTLTSSRFSGYINDGTNRRIYFSLENSGYNNWSRYRDNRGAYGDFNRTHYAPSIGESGDDSVPFIDRTPFCQSDDGVGRSVLSGEFARAFMARQQEK